MKFIKDAKLKVGAWAQERKEQAEKNRPAPDPAGVTVPAWLVRAAKFASWVATISLMYFLWLYTLDIARDRSADMHLTHAGTWTGNIQFWFPYVVGFAIVAFGIPYVAKIAIPTFMSLSWRGNFWPKLWALIIALSVSLVVIAGTFAVQGDTLMERDREAAVAVEQVQQGRAALEAQIASRRQELADMMNNRNAYLAQAASVGAEEWQRSYIDATPANDPQRDRIVRALGAARAADTVRAEIESLRTQLAASATTASVQGEVVTERTGWIADTLGWLEGVRAILLSLVMDIVALMMPWIALRLEQARARQMGVEASGWAPAGLRIEDLRDEEPVAPQPMKPAREVVTDAETGEELVKVKPREYWRKRKGKVQKLDIQPEIPPDETGVEYDGGSRSALTIGGLMDVPEQSTMEVGPEQGSPPVDDENRSVEAQADPVAAPELGVVSPSAPQDAENVEPVLDGQPMQPEPSEELEDLTFDDEPAAEAQDEPREPQTREDRLIANVAAE